MQSTNHSDETLEFHVRSIYFGIRRHKVGFSLLFRLKCGSMKRASANVCRVKGAGVKASQRTKLDFSYTYCLIFNFI